MFFLYAVGNKVMFFSFKASPGCSESSTKKRCSDVLSNEASRLKVNLNEHLNIYIYIHVYICNYICIYTFTLLFI